jgi:hypothetical protein
LLPAQELDATIRAGIHLKRLSLITGYDGLKRCTETANREIGTNRIIPQDRRIRIPRQEGVLRDESVKREAERKRGK